MRWLSGDIREDKARHFLHFQIQNGHLLAQRPILQPYQRLGCLCLKSFPATGVHDLNRYGALKVSKLNSYILLLSKYRTANFPFELIPTAGLLYIIVRPILVDPDIADWTSCLSIL